MDYISLIENYLSAIHDEEHLLGLYKELERFLGFIEGEGYEIIDMAKKQEDEKMKILFEGTQYDSGDIGAILISGKSIYVEVCKRLREFKYGSYGDACIALLYLEKRLGRRTETFI